MPTLDFRNRRSRLAVGATGLALLLSTAVAPVAIVAQDDGPDAAVRGLASAVTEKRFSELGEYFCPDLQGEALNLDFETALAANIPPGFEVGLVLDALEIGVEEFDVAVLDVVGDSATVAIEGSLTIAVDPEGARPLVAAILELTSGGEVTDEMVDAELPNILPALEAQFSGGGRDISADEVTVLRGEDGVWRICSPLSGTGDGTDDAVDPAIEQDSIQEE